METTQTVEVGINEFEAAVKSKRRVAEEVDELSVYLSKHPCLVKPRNRPTPLGCQDANLPLGDCFVEIQPPNFCDRRGKGFHIAACDLCVKYRTVAHRQNINIVDIIGAGGGGPRQLRKIEEKAPCCSGERTPIPLSKKRSTC